MALHARCYYSDLTLKRKARYRRPARWRSELHPLTKAGKPAPGFSSHGQSTTCADSRGTLGGKDWLSIFYCVHGDALARPPRVPPLEGGRPSDFLGRPQVLSKLFRGSQLSTHVPLLHRSLAHRAVRGAAKSGLHSLVHLALQTDLQQEPASKTTSRSLQGRMNSDTDSDAVACSPMADLGNISQVT